ncbi:hypothetical protein AB0N93_14565 [Streptomyces sp. NPDC091267]|uniref:hypothetical protein n=1 Tax=unclassified Streptomyces TaxID=2593676 RepID=UPI00342A97EA
MDSPFRYIGPAELLDLVRPGSEGRAVRSRADFDDWVSRRSSGDLAAPFTFVIDLAGVLRLAPRESEHVVCAGGAPVLSAGEIGFNRQGNRWVVDGISNQSTGYCPRTSSWPAVDQALKRAGLGHPAGFTHEVEFRRCTHCRELNIVRDAYFVCVFCDADLPCEWNADLP